MKNILLFSFLLFCSQCLYSQLADGSIAPDWTLEDINGDVHNLYDYLDEGKSVILDFGATWCVPCWNYHNQGVLESLYEDFGPDGTDQIMVFMIEGDAGTSQDCIYGSSSCVGGTTGDWTTGVTYPILNPPGGQANAVISDYNLNFWPTLYGIAPNGETYLIGQASYSEWESAVVNSLQLANSYYEIVDDGCSGDVNVTTVGGEGDLEFEWSNGFTTEDLIGAPTGIYTLTITDDNNFEVELGPIDLTSGGGNEIVYSEQEDVLCAGEFTGYLYVEAEGGSNDYTFEWSDGSFGPELFNLPGGDYFLTVTDNFNGCTSEAYYFIEESEPMILDIEVVDADCQEEGEVSIDVDGGSGSFSYNFPDFSTTSNDFSLPAGIYEVTVSDLYDCEVIETFEILATLPPMAVSSASGVLNCINSSSILSSIGSTIGTDIMYTWFDQFNNIIGTGSSVSVSNAGNYFLEVFDAATGCTSIDEVTVSMNTVTPISTTNYSNVIDCNNPTALLSGIGSSNSGVTYSWSTLDGVIDSANDALDITVSSGGTYTLLVTNSMNGCSTPSSVVVPSANTLPEVILAGETSFCEGTSAQLCITSNPGNNITWSVDGLSIASIDPCIMVSTASVIEATVTDPISGCSATGNTTTTTMPSPNITITGNTSFCAGGSTIICTQLALGENVIWMDETGQALGNDDCILVTQPGNYLAMLSNSFGCSVFGDTSIAMMAAPSSIVNGDESICTGVGGILCADESDQNYEWMLDGTLVGVDQCLSINAGGTYQLNASNDNCTSSSSTTIIEESIPSLDAQISGILDCNNQEVTIEAITNGTSVTWTDAQGVMLASGNSFTTNLAGQYFASTLSPLGCENTLSIVVEQDDTALPTATYDYIFNELTISFENQSSGTVNTYLWDFGDGNTSMEIEPSYTYASIGEYTVCLTVNNDCGSNSTCETLSILDGLNVDLLTEIISCHDGNDGSLELLISGGVEPYTIVSNPDIGNETFLTGISAGTYEIVVTDSNGESISSMVSFIEPIAIETEETIVNATLGNNDGSIVINTTGGTPGYTYLWEDGSTEADRSDLVAGFYTLEITDSLGCKLTVTYEIQELTSTEEIEFIERFVISPNPTSDQLNIEITSNQKASLSVELINNLGQVIYQSNMDTSSLTHQIDVSNFDNGIYFLSVRHESQSMTRKIMVID